MAQLVKCLVFKADNLSSISGAHMKVEEKSHSAKLSLTSRHAVAEQIPPSTCNPQNDNAYVLLLLLLLFYKANKSQTEAFRWRCCAVASVLLIVSLWPMGISLHVCPDAFSDFTNACDLGSSCSLEPDFLFHWNWIFLLLTLFKWPWLFFLWPFCYSAAVFPSQMCLTPMHPARMEQTQSDRHW